VAGRRRLGGGRISERGDSPRGAARRVGARREPCVGGGRGGENEVEEVVVVCGGVGWPAVAVRCAAPPPLRLVTFRFGFRSSEGGLASLSFPHEWGWWAAAVAVGGRTSSPSSSAVATRMDAVRGRRLVVPFRSGPSFFFAGWVRWGPRFRRCWWGRWERFGETCDVMLVGVTCATVDRYR
jgi:hypothetical protein